MAWRIEFDAAAAKELKALDPPIQRRLLGFLRTRVAPLGDPRLLGEPLRGEQLGAYWKYRVGDWRIICAIQDQRVVVRVVRLGNRREVYR